jgi:hypothetical protein
MAPLLIVIPTAARNLLLLFSESTNSLKLLGDTNMSNPKIIFVGEVAQIAGVGAVVLGVVLSLKHWPAALALIGGIAAYYVGKKLRAQ